MTANDCNEQIHAPIQVRIWDAVVNITPNASGEIVVTGEPPDVAGIVNLFIHESSLFVGRTKSDAVRVAIKVAERFGGQVLDLESIRASIRAGWLRLLKSHLSGDPAQAYGQQMNLFRTFQGLTVSFTSGRRRRISCATASVFLGDSQELVVRPGDKKAWKTKWEDLTQLSFFYSEPRQPFRVTSLGASGKRN